MRAFLLVTMAAIALSSAVWAASDANDSNAKGPPDLANTYVTVPSNDDLSSKVVGLDIYNNDGSDIGTIKDIALDPGGRSAVYIVSVGGFLGMGERYVAINPSALQITYNGGENEWHVSMNATADQLKAAPEFKYTGRWKSRKM